MPPRLDLPPAAAPLPAMHPGIAIAILRVRRGWRLQELADRAQVSARTISRCEKGQRLREEQRDRILRALNVTSGELTRVIDPYVVINSSSQEFQVRHAVAAVELRAAFTHLQAVMAFWDHVRQA